MNSGTETPIIAIYVALSESGLYSFAFIKTFLYKTQLKHAKHNISVINRRPISPNVLNLW